MRFRLALILSLICTTAFAQVTPGTSPLSIAKGGTAGATAPAARTNLGLGSMATQNAGAVAITGGTVTGLPTPTNASDAAIKSYVDGLASGLHVLAQTRLATAAVLPNTPTYANGTAGVGATLTAGANSTLTVDGVVANASDVIIVRNQASAFQNGIYTVTNAGSGSTAWVLTRVTYFDQAAEMLQGSYTFVTAGSTLIGTAFLLQTSVTTVGTDPLNWLIFSSSSTNVNGPGSAVSGDIASFNGTTGRVIQDSGISALSVNQVQPSRAVAITKNLSGLSSVTTQGYAAAGDGGGATFKNVSTAPFIDTGIVTGTGGGSITNAGTSCTNGTYLGITLTGGTGTNAQATIVVGGGIVTSVTITGTGGNAYTVNDVLGVAASTLGTCTGFSWTVGSITTPTGSFTDAVGTHFQYIVDQGNYANIRQFGAACNWTKTAGDAGSTNDTTTLQNALNWAGSLLPPTIDGGGLAGQTLIVPRCYSLFTTIQVPYGVRFIGQGPQSAGLKVADSIGAGLNPIILCDPTTHLACFGTYIGKMTLFPGTGTGNSNTTVIFSNNIQQALFASELWIYGGAGRDCIQITGGFGGAATSEMADIECTISTGAAAGISIDLGGSQTLVKMSNIKIEAGGSGLTTNGLNILGGFVDVNTFHSEGISSAIFLNIPANSGFTSFHNISGGSNCINLITRQSGSAANQNVAGRLNPNGCTNTINNAGAITTGIVIADTVF